MQNYTNTIKKFVGSFLGVAGVSALIGLPGLAQANLNSSYSKASSQSTLAQTTPSGGTRSAPGPANSNPTAPGPANSNPTAPGPANSSPTAPGPANSSPTPTSLDTEFITKAAQSDMTEIQTSQLALKKSKTKAVTDYARQMIQHHTTSSRQLKPIAKSKNVALPKDIGPENKALLTSLQKLNGKNFDEAYIQGQVDAHTRTEAEYQRYLEQGQDQQLKAFASKFSPIVAQHLQMAQRMVAAR